MSYESLLKLVEDLMKDERLRNAIRKRIKEFGEMKNASWDKIFSELCFCILTANSSAELGIKIQKELGAEGFLKLPEEELSRRLAELGHRYSRVRTRYIIEARRYARDLKTIVSSLPEEKAREWLVKNIKGIGMKEASHFLRNIGAKNLAIVDRHILRILKDHGLIDNVPKNLTKRKYLEIEGILKKLSRDLGITPAELDLYLWYSKTGKVLK
ncbi:MAG: N-glycosylase/DNA lyase [Euryarchaeota archaeon]|nr:N-glycosylase/DNA lyase [Euryarchaeota archaeon]